MRLIDADELKKSIEEDEELKGNSLAYLLMNLMTCYIDDTPTIDAEPVLHGHWEKYGMDIAEHPWHCSVCGWSDHHIDQRRVREFNRCPMCFAKMDEVSE